MMPGARYARAVMIVIAVVVILGLVATMAVAPGVP
jgi:hypothetical protein